MKTLQEKLHSIFTPEVLADLIDKTNAIMQGNYKALSERAAGMANANMYQDLIDYCYEQVGQYIDNPDNMMKILSDPNNIQPAYNAMAETEEFKAISMEEYKGFPRVILMTVLAGSEAAAANEAYEMYRDSDPEIAPYLDNLANVYHKYFSDAVSYGKGEDKKVVMTGHRQ